MAESAVNLGGAQIGEAEIGAAAGRDVVTINALADVPPGWAEMIERVIDRLHHNGLQVSALERQLSDYMLAESLERERRQREMDAQHDAEQGMLMDGIRGMREQIADLARVDRAWLWWLLSLSVLALAGGGLLAWLTILHAGG